MSLARRVGRLVQHLGDGGLAQAAEIACSRGIIPNWLFYLHRVDVFRLLRFNTNATRRSLSGYALGTADAGEIGQLIDLTGAEGRRNGTEALFQRYFDDGGRCVVARCGAHIVAYNWCLHQRYVITDDGYRRRKLELCFEPNVVFFGNGLIHPEHRLRGIFPQLVAYALSSYGEGTHFYTSIDRMNKGSQLAHRRLGFEVVATLRCNRVLGSPYFWTHRTSNQGGQLAGWGTPSMDLGKLEGQRKQPALSG